MRGMRVVGGGPNYGGVYDPHVHVGLVVTATRASKDG